jgi:hypothetical protein
MFTKYITILFCLLSPNFQDDELSISRFAIKIREEYHILDLKPRVGWMVSYSWLMEKNINNPTVALYL